jgi:hypothetical protein
MRAKEFIQETKSKGVAEKISDRRSGPLPGVFVQTQLRNTDPYMQYRYAMAVAAARSRKENGIDFDQESAWAENITQVMFVPEDEETIRLASKLMGVTPTKIADNKSREPKSTYTASPVAKPKKNRYGV